MVVVVEHVTGPNEGSGVLVLEPRPHRQALVDQARVGVEAPPLVRRGAGGARGGRDAEGSDGLVRERLQVHGHDPPRAVGIRPLREPGKAHLSCGLAEEDARLAGLEGAAPGRHLHTSEGVRVVGHDVDDAQEGIGPEEGRPGTADDLDLLDVLHREVQVDDGGAAADVLVDAVAVEEDEHVLGAAGGEPARHAPDDDPSPPQVVGQDLDAGDRLQHFLQCPRAHAPDLLVRHHRDDAGRLLQGLRAAGGDGDRDVEQVVQLEVLEVVEVSQLLEECFLRPRLRLLGEERGRGQGGAEEDDAQQGGPCHPTSSGSFL